jgi:hypothetical protein
MMAREWSVPPWTIEAEATLEWVERWKVFARETQRAQRPTHSGKGRKVLSG